MDYSNIYKNAIPLPIDPFYKEEYNCARRLKSIIISDALGKCDEFKALPYSKQVDILIHIENSCTNETIRKARGYNLRCDFSQPQFEYIYHTICYSIICALDQDDNILIKKIINNEVDLNTIAGLSVKDLTPEKYEDITSQVSKRVNTEQSIKFTEMYFCKKCKRNQTTAERIQSRANDEGSSWHITCLFCGTKWFH